MSLIPIFSPVAAKLVTLEDGGTGTQNSSSADVTFSGVDIGTAASDRIVVVMHGSYLHLATDIKIGGSSGTKIVELDSTNATCAIWAKAVASGTTADIQIIYGSAAYPRGIYVCAMYGASISAHATASSNEDTPAPMSASLAIPAGGAAFGAAYYTHGSTRNTFVWANITEKADLDLVRTGMSMTASQTTSATAITPTITCTPSNSQSADVDCAMALASFAPA